MLDNTLPLRVKEVIRETPEAVTLVLEPISDQMALPPYEPGQFLTVVAALGGVSLRRAYSLATTPYTHALPAITVKQVPGGQVSTYLNQQVQAGDYLEVLPPSGTFTTSYEASRCRHLVFIGAGSGITPLYALLQAALDQEPGTRVSLFYGSRDEAHIIYRQDLASLQARYGADRLRITHSLSQAGPGWSGLRGRLTAARLEALVPSQAAGYFLCGPTGLMEAAREALQGLGVAEGCIYQESFSAPPTEEEPIAQRTQPAQVTFIARGVRYACTAAPGETLLDTALMEGLDIPYTCGQGLCNTCRARCTDGQVAMEASEGLSPEERAAGYVLTCVGHPVSDTVTLALDS